jgi:succinate dehydrogenase / fumarate reductase, flavoprotein subunit
MRIYPAVHYTMGGLWVDYNLMTTIPGLYALGEANFSDHGANRLGASALMQGLADGYFILPATLGNYLAEVGTGVLAPEHPEFARAESLPPPEPPGFSGAGAGEPWPTSTGNWASCSGNTAG